VPRLAGMGTARLVYRPIEIGEEGAGVLDQDRAGRRQLDAPPRTRQERESELLLERLDLSAQRTLSHVQAFCRPAEVPLFGDGDEIAKVTELRRVRRRE